MLNKWKTEMEAKGLRVNKWGKPRSWLAESTFKR